MKIKTIITRQVPAILVTAVLFASCQKNLDSKSNAVSKPNIKQATDMAGLQSLLAVDDIQQMILGVSPNTKEAAQILAGSCPPIRTYNPAPNVYPRTVTVDWGTGCTNNVTGITRSGKITFAYTDTLATVGARLITTYNNYFINGVHIEGKATITHNDSATGNDVYALKQINRKVTQPNGDFITYNSDRRLVKLVPND